MRFACRAVDLDFIAKAPWRFENTVELDATPEKVFDLFADGESWPRWFKDIRHVEWTSPEPRGVGATRTVALTSVTFTEYFLVWDRGRRFTFRFVTATRPIFRAGIEDYRLEPIGNGRTRFIYGVYVTPTILVRAFGFMAKPMFAKMFRSAAKGIRKHLESRV
jgi:hypothetical protein